MSALRTGFSSAHDSAEAIQQIVGEIGDARPRAVVFFAFVDHDGEKIGRALEARYPGAAVIGCSGNGAFSDHGYGKNAVAAIALGADEVERAVAALVPNEPSPAAGAARAGDAIRAALGSPMRELDPERYAGLALVEGATRREEAINEALGNVAPFFQYVGGSAGDDIRFERTWVYASGRLVHDASALMVLEMKRRFTIVKTCNYVATDRRVTVTRSDPARRLIFELDGHPAAEYYAAATGTTVDKLDFAHFLTHPLGLMIDDEPWLRSGVRAEGSSLFFACAVHEGATLDFMRGEDLVANASRAIDGAEARLGARARGGVLFNCAYRMIEAQVKGVESDYHGVLSRVKHVGLHTNGESYLGHLNQTLVGLLFA